GPGAGRLPGVPRNAGAARRRRPDTREPGSSRAGTGARCPRAAAQWARARASAALSPVPAWLAVRAGASRDRCSAGADTHDLPDVAGARRWPLRADAKGRHIATRVTFELRYVTRPVPAGRTAGVSSPIWRRHEDDERRRAQRFPARAICWFDPGA